jgi:hypothetical protein
LEFDDEKYLSDSRAYQVARRFQVYPYTDPSPLNYIIEEDAAGNGAIST